LEDRLFFLLKERWLYRSGIPRAFSNNIQNLFR
jgi:hypothetical protein